MSTSEHNTHAANGTPVNRDVTFEPRDINIGTIARYLIYLAITIAISLALCVPFLKLLTRMTAENDPPLPPVRAQMSRQQLDEQEMPPEPRLQGTPGHESDPQADMRLKVLQDKQANETLAWVDKDKGIAQIPVSEAMKIIAEKGAIPVPPAEDKKSAAQEKRK